MDEEQQPVTRTDVAEAIRGLAGFPWDEMLTVQRAMLKSLNESEEERGKLLEAVRGSGVAAEIDTGAAAAKSAAKVVKTLEGVQALQSEIAKAVSGYATSLNRCEQILVTIMAGVHDARRGFRFWGLVVLVLLFLGTIDDVLYLAGRLGRIFG